MTIKADLYRYGGLVGLKGFLKGLRAPGFRYMFLFRHTNRHKRYSILGIFFALLLRRYSYKYGFQIPRFTDIGKGLYIGHFGIIVINGRARIGNNCNIAHGVTIGETFRGKLKGCPVIGNNVWIGTGAVVVGGIHIGSNVLISPNAFVNIDVPENSIVLGNPCKVISRLDPCKDYINFVLASK